MSFHNQSKTSSAKNERSCRGCHMFVWQKCWTDDTWLRANWWRWRDLVVQLLSCQYVGLSCQRTFLHIKHNHTHAKAYFTTKILKHSPTQTHYRFFTHTLTYTRTNTHTNQKVNENSLTLANIEALVLWRVYRERVRDISNNTARRRVKKEVFSRFVVNCIWILILNVKIWNR